MWVHPSCIKHCLCGSSSNLVLDNVHCDAEKVKGHMTLLLQGKMMDAAFRLHYTVSARVAFQGLVIWREHIQEIP